LSGSKLYPTQPDSNSRFDTLTFLTYIFIFIFHTIVTYCIEKFFDAYKKFLKAFILNILKQFRGILCVQSHFQLPFCLAFNLQRIKSIRQLLEFLS